MLSFLSCGVAAHFVSVKSGDHWTRTPLPNEAASGRASWGRFFFLCVAVWLKFDGTEVHYLHFAEQISAVTSGDTVHIVGLASKEISALKFSGAIIVKL